MNILILNYEFPPLGGGAATATKHLLEEFSGKEDSNIDLITSSASGYDEEQFSQNIRIYKLNVGKKELHYWTQKEILSYSLQAIKLIKKLVRSKKYDLCHAFFGVPCGAIAYLFRKKIPYIVSLRGSDVPGYNKRFSIHYIFLTPLIKRIWKRSKAVIANSLGLKELALKSSPKQEISIIYNGIDADKFKPGLRNSGKINILTVSRLIRRKGVRYLIEAIPLVLKKDKNIKLTIVGGGNQEQELQGLVKELSISDYVDFKAYVNREKINKIYSDSDVFVLPSLNEGMSNTILEAMASGLPIISTNTSGGLELIRENGILVPMEDSESIANAILRIINDKELRAYMGKKSREMVEEKMPWKNMAEKYLEVYKKC